MRRVVINGPTGSGKTTLARELSRRLDVPHVELDGLHHEPGWTEAPQDVFLARVAEATQGDAWVVEGNYSVIQPTLWPRADTIILLLYPFPIVLRQLLGRTFRRAWTKEELWKGNRETFLKAIGPDSIILWLFRSYQKRKRAALAAMVDPRWADKERILFRHPRELRDWLDRQEAVPPDSNP